MRAGAAGAELPRHEDRAISMMFPTCFVLSALAFPA